MSRLAAWPSCCSPTTVEEAKRRLERTAEPVDAISYAVGYEDPASFRRLFKRITGVSPGTYRRKLQLPAFARPARREVTEVDAGTTV